MFKRVLVANRGEIAQRVIRCCIEMGVECVAVYSKADENEIYVPFATDSICIGEASSSSSYLNMTNIISAALCMECDAVHPGYGFLSENAEFARLCEEHGLKFIGPPPEVIEMATNRPVTITPISMAPSAANAPDGERSRSRARTRRGSGGERARRRRPRRLQATSCCRDTRRNCRHLRLKATRS